jgi:hypothetical protein
MNNILISVYRFMLYHLFQTAISKDVTLHVSANNNAMVKRIKRVDEQRLTYFFDSFYTRNLVSNLKNS